MKNKLYKAMAAVLAVGVCLMPSTMAQAAETDENALLYSFPVNTENSVGFIPANEHEKIAPDAFFVSGDRIFLVPRQGQKGGSPASKGSLPFCAEELSYVIMVDCDFN